MKLLTALSGSLVFLASSVVHAYPESLDVAGIQLGDDISDVRRTLYERHKESFLSFQRNSHRHNQATFTVDTQPREQWNFLWLPEGQIVAIERQLDYSRTDSPPENEATAQALYEKYGEPIADGTSIRRIITWQSDRAGNRLETNERGQIVNNVCQGAPSLMEGRQIRRSTVEDCGIHLRVSYGVNQNQSIVRISSTLFDAATYLDYITQEERENEPAPESSTGGAADI